MSEHINDTSLDITSDNLSKLQAVFPQFVRDGQVDFDSLKDFFASEHILAESEKYGLNWAGKSNAFKSLRTVSTGTLIPEPDQSVNWDETGNVFIEGDNLEVLKLLQKHYREKIKMIYIDPPYNTGKDFVYKDNFTAGIADYYEQTGQTQNGIKMTANTEKNGRYHSDWLTMMYPRLFLAKNLLTDDGVIFVSIDDNEVANLRLVMDEIFGEENFIGQITIETANGVFGTRATGLYSTLVKVKDYVVVYSKTNLEKKFQPLYMPTNERYDTHYSMIIDENLNRSSFLDYIEKTESIKKYFEKYKLKVSLDNISKIMQIDNAFNKIITGELSEKIYQDVAFSLNLPVDVDAQLGNGSIIKWKDYLIFKTNSGQGKVRQLIPFRDSLRITDDYTPEYRRSVAIGDLWEGFDNDMKNVSNEGISFFDTPKPLRLIKQLIKWCNISKNDMVLDFFAGSGTTAHAVMDLNADDEGSRKWISVQLPEVTDENSEAYKAGYKTISQITRERIRRAGQKIGKGDTGFKSYRLQSSNYRRWHNITDENTIEDLLDQSKLFMEKPLIDNYNELDVVYEILLKEGFSLNSHITKPDLTNGSIPLWVVINTAEPRNKISICFADKVTMDDINKTGVGVTEGDMFVCFDSALSDTDKVNISRKVNLKTI